MSSKRSEWLDCSASAGTDWNGLIISTLLEGPARFSELVRLVPGLSERMLAERLGVAVRPGPLAGTPRAPRAMARAGEQDLEPWPRAGVEAATAVRQSGVMYVAALRITIRIPQSNSLKAKRSVVRHLVEVARHRFGVSACEVAEQDRWQLAVLGFAAVASSARHAGDLLDRTERFVWSHPELEVVDTSRHWVEVASER